MEHLDPSEQLFSSFEFIEPSNIGTHSTIPGIYSLDLPTSTQSTLSASGASNAPLDVHIELSNITAPAWPATPLQPACFTDYASPPLSTPSSSSSYLSPPSPIPSLLYPSPPTGYPATPLSPVQTSSLKTQPLQLSSFGGYPGDLTGSLEHWTHFYPSLFVANENWSYTNID